MKQTFLSIWIFTWILFGCTSCEMETKQSTKTTPPAKVELPKVTFNADSTYHFVQKQVDFGPRTPGSSAHKACADWLEATLKDFGAEVIVQESKVSAALGGIVPMYNIIGAFNPMASKRILLTAHWDTRLVADQDDEEGKQKDPIDGANDGGSGVAILLEIARQLSLNPLQNIGVDILLLDVEDQGLSETEDTYCLGAQYWAQNLHKPNYTAEFGILLDMVGAGDAVFFQEYYSLQYAPHVVKKVWDVAAQKGYSSYFTNKNGGGVTDDHYYINKFAKIPTIDIIHHSPQGFGKFWHTHNDNMKVINKNTLKVVGDVVLTVVRMEDLVL
ncbi:MAG: M28 family peptidase [Chitinophagales bacterium]